MFQKIEPRALDQNVFSAIGKQWMLVTAGTAERCNTMTASWGGLGVLWGKDVATVYIRPQRYTFAFMERQEYFTLAFFGEEFRQALQLCGSKSGREVDKIAACGFTVKEGAGGAPYFEQAQTVLVCRKLYWQDLDPAHFLDSGIDRAHYPGKDYHRMYIGEIAEVLVQEPRS